MILKTRTVLLIFLLNIGFVTTTLAHKSGHGHQELKAWDMEGSPSLNGQFLWASEDLVYLEGEENQKITIERASLSDEDQAYVNQRIKAIAQINGVQTKEVIQSTWNFALLFQIIGGAVVGLILLFSSFKIYRNTNFKKHKAVGLSLGMVGLLLLGASCSKDDDDIVTNAVITVAVDPSDPVYITEAFNGFANVSTSYDNDYFYIESTGLPEYDDMMTGITTWIDQVPVPQWYDDANFGKWQIPLNPTLSSSPLSIDDHFRKGAIGMAVNGIPIFNPINASGLISAQIGELDAYGGHSGRGDDYHYHTAPMHLDDSQGTKPIAYGLDGFAVYGSLEPDGTAMNTLDIYHGHEWDGSYHYHGTSDYPYMMAAMRGEVNLSGTAPEDQVSPQPVAPAFRAIHPMTSSNGTTLITDCVPNGNGYTITYEFNGVTGTVAYTWDTNDLFTFIYNDVDGSTTTESYQRQ